MIISISVACASEENLKLPSSLAKISHDEVVLIELQGSLNIECRDAADRNGQLVGNLRFDETGSKPTLTIGNHLLEGKIVTLPKPIAILHRDNAAETSKQWCIAAVVKRKIAFSKRPMPITRQS